MANKPVERVVWRQGMLMSPHHLQQQERFLEQSLAGSLAAIMPVSWGVQRCGIDEAALKSGQLKLLQFAGIFPDGTFMRFEHSEDAPAARSVAEAFPTTASSLEVFLAFPLWRERASNFAGQDEQSDGRTRFRLSRRSISDLAGSDNDVSMEFAAPNLTIRFGTEDREDFETIKIAEVVRDQTGAFELAPQYIPPVLNIAASRYLSHSLERLTSVMVAKQRALADARRQRDEASVEFTNQDVTRYLLLNTLNTHIPLFRHFASDTSAPPLALHLALGQLAGQLATFSGQVDPSSLPPYHHTDLRSSFDPLFGHIHDMLGSAVRERVIPIPLEPRKDGVWIGMLKDERLPRCSSFVLAVESQASEQDVANRLPHLSKIASWKQISQIVQAATPGVPLRPTHRPPPEVPIRPRVVYFLLDTSNEHWQHVMAERTIAIYLPPAFDPSRTTLSLVGVPPRTS